MSSFANSAFIFKPALRQQGMSMVELMIGMLIGLIIMLAILSSVSLVSVQRQNTVAGSDANLSGQFAVDRLETAGRQAGVGLYENGQLICSTINSYYNGTVTSDGGILTPIKIVDGGATGSDKISFTYGSGTNSISHLVDQMPNQSANYTVGNQGRLETGDLAIVGVPGSTYPCTLFQVTAFPPGGGNCNGITSSCLNVQHNPGASGLYNPSNPNNVWTNAPIYSYQNAAGVAGPAVISRLGKFHTDTYEVLCNTLISHDQSATPSCTQSPLAFINASPLVSNIVQLKAQYGISASADSNIVINWTSATGATWANPTSADLAKVKAIRVVIVSRSREQAAGNVTSTCTNAAGVVNTGPCSFQDSESPAINLSSVAVPSGKTWSNYRYRVYLSVIPLRNVLWNH
jgi:type IV pilus assembly protein PilW